MTKLTKKFKKIINIITLAVVLVIAIIWLNKVVFKYTSYYFDYQTIPFFIVYSIYLILIIIAVFLVRKIIVYFIFKRKEKPVREIIQNKKKWLAENWFKLSIIIIILAALTFHFYIKIQQHNLMLVKGIAENCFRNLTDYDNYEEYATCAETYNSFGIFAKPMDIIFDATLTIWGIKEQYPKDFE